ncbi:MAG: hypothetical protein KKA05_07610 [Alphaproteobacteria bacterium]|nr:hypothetical protein [Alphaproteobacteria bacterium]
MKAEAHHIDPFEGLNAAFMRNHRGQVCIAFADPDYARAEAIFVDRDNMTIYAVIHQAAHLVGTVSQGMADAFVTSQEALLTALRPDGSVLELSAPVQVG